MSNCINCGKHLISGRYCVACLHDRVQEREERAMVKKARRQKKRLYT